MDSKFCFMNVHIFCFSEVPNRNWKLFFLIKLLILLNPEKPDDKIATPLRKRCSFTPTPGAHLDQFCADTAKLLISLIDEEKLNQDLLIDDEQGIVKYSDIKGTFCFVFFSIFSSS